GAGHEVVAVIDVDHVAVLRMEAGEHDYAGGGGGDRRATVGEKIDALVHRPLPCKRIHAPPVGRGVIRRLDRHHRRDHLFLHRLLEELRFEHAHHVVAALDVARERGKLVAEFGERQVLRRHQGPRSTAQAGASAKAVPTRWRSESVTDLALASRSEIRIICTYFLPYSRTPMHLPKLDRILSAESDLQPLLAKAREIRALAGLVERFLSADLANQA